MKLWPSLFQSLVVFAATLIVYVAIDWNPITKYVPLKDPDKKAVAAAAVSLVVAFLYWIGLLIGSIKPMRKLVDKGKARFLGQFVSIHENCDTIAIFEITFAVLSQRYYLHGDTYSRNPLGHIGYWNSSTLDMDREILTYVYTGNRYGMCKIEFNNEISKGSGHFVEDVDPPQRSASAYTRISRQVMKTVLPGSFKWRLSNETDRLTFLKALQNLSITDPIKYGELFKLR